MRRTPVAERVAGAIRKAILAGEYPVHSFLPPVRDLAQRYEAGERKISEALAALGKEGVVERTRGRGTRVLPAQWWKNRKPIGVLRIVRQYVGFQAGSNEMELIQEGVEDALTRFGCDYDVYTFLPHDFTPARPLRTSPTHVKTEQLAPLSQKCQGLIFIEDMRQGERLLALHRAGYPVVVANLENDLDLTCTRVDHCRVAHQAVCLLASMGHQRIAFMRRGTEYAFYEWAEQGYREGLAAAGLQVHPQWILKTSHESPLHTYKLARKLLQREDRPSAFVCARDYLSDAVCHVCADLGLEVGRDVSVVGYDDLSWGSNDHVLTTFREPCFEMGSVAAEMLVDRIVHGPKPAERRMIDAPLIIRRSAGPALHAFVDQSEGKTGFSVSVGRGVSKG